MKMGLRTPNLKKMVKARTTGKLKRQIKRTIIPGYGRKGMGIVHPRKAIYNKIYNKIYKKTTFSIFDLFKWLFK